MEQEPKLGPTGRFTHPKLTPDDEGEIATGVTTVDDMIVIHYGKAIVWTAMTPEQAIELAGVLTKRANDIITKRKQENG